MITEAAISFGVGVFVRLWNEHQKQKAADAKLQMAMLTKQHNILQETREHVAKTTFAQIGIFVLLGFAVVTLFAFPLVAAFTDLPLYLFHTYLVDTGFWIFSGVKEVTELVTINGLYLPEEATTIMTAAVSFFFGVVGAGVGRR